MTKSRPTSVREMVKAIQIELLPGDVAPARARELLMTLTSLLGSCQAEVTRTEIAFTRVLAGYLDTEGKANRAKIRAELSPEYQAREEARNVFALVTDMTRALKVILRSIEEEARLCR